MDDSFLEKKEFELSMKTVFWVVALHARISAGPGIGPYNRRITANLEKGEAATNTRTRAGDDQNGHRGNLRAMQTEPNGRL
jgi:hypothetical protein